MWPFSSSGDSDDGCGGHHYGEPQVNRSKSYMYTGTASRREGDVYDVYVIESPVEKRCQHTNCMEKKQVSIKKEYVAINDVHDSESEFFDAMEEDE